MKCIVIKSFNDKKNKLKHYEPSKKPIELSEVRFKELNAKGYVNEYKEEKPKKKVKKDELSDISTDL